MELTQAREALVSELVKVQPPKNRIAKTKIGREVDELIYDNDWTAKRGQLNNGSGTTPTLVGDRFVAICDNDYHQINRAAGRH